MENKKRAVIFSILGVGIFVLVAFLLWNKPVRNMNNIFDNGNDVKTSEDNKRNSSEYVRSVERFVLDLPCGVTDFDSPYVKPVQCEQDKMVDGIETPLKIRGMIKDEQSIGLEGVKIVVNNGESFYTDKNGFYESNIKIDSKKGVISLAAEKQGYTPIRAVYNAFDRSGSDVEGEYFANDIQMRITDFQKIILSESGDTKIISKKFPGVSATIPASSLVNSKGEIVRGEIMAEVTYLDPDKPNDKKIIPGFNGNMVGVDRKGRQVTIQSDGMVFFHFKKVDSDEILQPKKGSSVTITQPLLDRMYNYYYALWEESSKTDPLSQFRLYKKDEFNKFIESDAMYFNYWYYNKRTGLWEEWPVEDYIIDLEKKLVIMVVPYLY